MSPGVVHLTEQLLLSGVAALLVFAALHDIATRTVPNWLPSLVLVGGIGLRLCQGSLVGGLIAALIVFLVSAFCWRRGWMGGADVKLLAASALIVPPIAVANLILSISLAGGLLIVVYIALRTVVGRPSPNRPAGFLARICRVERRRIRRLESLPYASAIAAGALFILLTV